MARPLTHFPRPIGSPTSGPLHRLSRSSLSYTSIAGCGRLNLQLLYQPFRARPPRSALWNLGSEPHWCTLRKHGAERERADFKATTPESIGMAQWLKDRKAESVGQGEHGRVPDYSPRGASSGRLQSTAGEQAAAARGGREQRGDPADGFSGLGSSHRTRGRLTMRGSFNTRVISRFFSRLLVSAKLFSNFLHDLNWNLLKMCSRCLHLIYPF